MEISEIPQLVRNAGRFREVVAILAKHGLADWLSDTSPDWINRLRGIDVDRDKFSTEQRIRIAITELGTTFIKLGQVLSTRPDLVGRPLAEELASLRADTPTDTPEAAAAMIEAELGGKVDELFAEFDSVAMASASIGQVHRAKTHCGKRVVVKVQHPGIEKRIVNDVEIMIRLAALGEQHSAYLRQFRPVETTREFQKTLMQELDFERELRNMIRFRESFKDDHDVRFPEPHLELCSRRVLTMELFDGISISDTNSLQSSGYELEQVAKRGANLFVDMIFRDGFYHADPHPGNLMVLPNTGAVENGKTNLKKPFDVTCTIGVLDCGMVGRIDESLRQDFELALIASVKQDAAAIAEIVARVGDVPADFDEPALLRAMQEFLDDYSTQSIDHFDLSGCLNKIVDVIRSHQILLPANIAMLLKVLVMLEGTAQQLSPKFCLAELIKPYGEQAMRDRFSPKQLFSRLKSNYSDWERFFGILPKDLADILHNLKRGKFDVHVDHRRLEPIVNRLIKCILAAALFMGSTSLCSYQVPPTIFGYSILGFLGCAVAVYMGWSITRLIDRG